MWVYGYAAGFTRRVFYYGSEWASLELDAESNGGILSWIIFFLFFVGKYGAVLWIGRVYV